MFDGVTLSRYGHSADCVTLSDGTVVVSVFGGQTSPSVVVSNPCFYQWGNSMIIVIQEDVSVSFAVFRSPSSIYASFWSSTSRSCSTC